MKYVLSAVGVLGAVGLAACAMSEMPTPQDGARLFADNCASCHGTTAQGDGALATSISPAPPDLTRIAARNGGVFPRAAVLSTIDGYSRGVHVDRVMPEWGDLLEGDLVPVEVDGVMTPTSRPLAALLAYLEAAQN